VTELLDPHYNGRPITYNHYLTDNVQKAQADRRRRNFEKILKNLKTSTKNEYEYPVSPSKLLALLEQRTEIDIKYYASDLAVDYIQAYYKMST
jgi:hypothetical protein